MSSLNSSRHRPVHKARMAAGRDHDGMTPAEGFAVKMAREALTTACRELAPKGSNPRILEAVAVAGAFADLVAAMAVTGTARDLVEVTNKQLASAGLELVRVRRQ